MHAIQRNIRVNILWLRPELIKRPPEPELRQACNAMSASFGQSTAGQAAAPLRANARFLAEVQPVCQFSQPSKIGILGRYHKHGDSLGGQLHHQ